jgi:hypothetical protein
MKHSNVELLVESSILFWMGLSFLVLVGCFCLFMYLNTRG